MRGTVDKLSIQPILNPCGEFIVIIDCTLTLFKQRVIHFAFGCCYQHYTILMSADVLVLAGIVTVNVLVDVFVFPKSKTQTAPLSPAL